MTVDFTVTETSNGNKEVAFRFEGESLQHRRNKSMRQNMYEVG